MTLPLSSIFPILKLYVLFRRIISESEIRIDRPISPEKIKNKLTIKIIKIENNDNDINNKSNNNNQNKRYR